MSTVLVKHTFDMNDADYVYGCQVLEKENWEKFKEWAKKQEIIEVYHNNDYMSRPFDDIDFKVIELTEEQTNTLEDLNLLDFGMDIPGYYAYLHPEDKDEDEYDDEY